MMKPKKLIPGALIEEYTEFVTGNAYYVDKTLMIEQILTNPSKVQLYTRPRRFGKTLSLLTFKAFIEHKVDRDGNYLDPRHWFEGRKILECGDEILSKMGKYPVIFLTLKDCGQPTYESCLNQFRFILGNLFGKYEAVLRTKLTGTRDQKLLDEYCDEMPEETLKNALCKLLEWIKLVTGVNPYILIDEYDVPLQWAYTYGFYDKMVSFIRALFGNGLKTNNDNFEKAILTGCLRVSKESIFTGFNNLKVYDIDSDLPHEYFGFTKEEVQEMLAYYDLSERYDDIREWYDGYQFGTRHIYNPYSLVQSVEALTMNSQWPFEAFWTNTSGNDVIRTLIEKHPECHADIEKLIHNQSIYKPIQKTMTYRDLDAYDDNIWTLLYFTGYIKSVSKKQVGEEWIHELRLVNKEIRSIFPRCIRDVLAYTVKSLNMAEFYQAVWDNRPSDIKKILEKVLLTQVSYYDTKEMFYHGMMLGMMTHSYFYKIKSNRENGTGRTDIELLDMSGDRAVVFEFKWCKEKRELNQLPAAALKQVHDNHYAEAIREDGYTTVYAVGIGFCEKTCEVVIEQVY